MISAILEFIGITQLIRKSIEAEEVSKQLSMQEESLFDEDSSVHHSPKINY